MHINSTDPSRRGFFSIAVSAFFSYFVFSRGEGKSKGQKYKEKVSRCDKEKPLLAVGLNSTRH